MRSKDKVFAIVLAGGRSTRMGRDKAFLPIGNQILLQHQIQKCQTFLKPFGSPQEILVSGFREGISGIPDLVPGMGPLAGVWSCLEARLKKTPFEDSCSALILPVDMPEISPQTLQCLFENFLNLSYRDLPRVAAFEDFELPLMMEVSQKTLRLLRDLCLDPENRKRSFREYLRQSQARRVPVPQKAGAHEFDNLNTPEQWEIFLARTVGTKAPDKRTSGAPS